MAAAAAAAVVVVVAAVSIIEDFKRSETLWITSQHIASLPLLPLPYSCLNCIRFVLMNRILVFTLVLSLPLALTLTLNLTLNLTLHLKPKT